MLVIHCSDKREFPPFNPNRRHPVTGRVRPHKGVDFSVSQGTPVIAPADGTVEKVAYQAGGAGRYVMLRHGREYQTVYMHLSKSLVKAGQTVKKANVLRFLVTRAFLRGRIYIMNFVLTVEQ